MNILVIKLGALGDVVLAFQPFADIRAHHPGARITLLTGPAFGFLRDAPWFDDIRIDRRPPWWHLSGVLALRRSLQGFDLVYDLQTSGRSSRYHRLAGRPAWSGIAPGASLAHANPGRNAMHTMDRQRDQLAMAGVPSAIPAGLSWLGGPVPHLPTPYALLIPGAAPHRPGKRWPRFPALAATLHARGLHPVVAGAGADGPLAAAIRAECPAATDLTGRTSIPALATLARGAACAVGNDTGPMHLAAALGTPSVVLFGPDSDPALTAPRGSVTVLRVADLAALPVGRVAAALEERHTLRSPPP